MAETAPQVQPWQLLLYDRSLKKQLSFQAIRAFLPSLLGKRCFADLLWRKQWRPQLAFSGPGR